MLDDYEKYLRNLPVIPQVATKILAMAEDRLEISFRQLEDIIKLDPGLTAKILKIANSALYARQREIKSLQMALTLLGFKNIKSLVLLVTASSTFTRHRNTEFYQLFWSHSILSAFCAKHVAVRSNRKEISEEAFLAALLHDIGQVALFNADPESYRPVVETLKSGGEIEPAEQRLFGQDHRVLGGAVLEKWNFPELYAAAAREHESRNITSPHKALIVIVSVADLLSESLRAGSLKPEREELLRELVSHTSLGQEDLAYYRERFLPDCAEDPLFRECRSMFGLRGDAG